MTSQYAVVLYQEQVCADSITPRNFHLSCLSTAHFNPKLDLLMKSDLEQRERWKLIWRLKRGFLARRPDKTVIRTNSLLDPVEPLNRPGSKIETCERTRAFFSFTFCSQDLIREGMKICRAFWFRLDFSFSYVFEEILCTERKKCSSSFGSNISKSVLVASEPPG